MVYPFLKGVGNELKADSLILKKIHTAVKMFAYVCTCVFFTAAEFSMVVDSRLDRFQLLKRGYGDVSLHPRFFSQCLKSCQYPYCLQPTYSLLIDLQIARDPLSRLFLLQPCSHLRNIT